MNCDWGWNTLWNLNGPVFWVIILAVLMIAVWKTFSVKSAATTGGMSCYQCGNRIEYSFMRCPHCSAELKKHCPECSRIVESAWAYCPSCNTFLNKKTNNTVNQY